eukprot:363203-Chlamydomonas_euryale.AAC.11
MLPSIDACCTRCFDCDGRASLRTIAGAQRAGSSTLQRGGSPPHTSVYAASMRATSCCRWLSPARAANAARYAARPLTNGFTTTSRRGTWDAAAGRAMSAAAASAAACSAPLRAAGHVSAASGAALTASAAERLLIAHAAGTASVQAIPAPSAPLLPSGPPVHSGATVTVSRSVSSSLPALMSSQKKGCARMCCSSMSFVQRVKCCCSLCSATVLR